MTRTLSRIGSLLLAATCIPALAILPATPVAAQQAGEQFLLIGTLEKFELNTAAADPGSPLLVGATMRVSGHDVVIPRNLLIRFPTRFLSPRQAFDMAPTGSIRSGLALDDNPPVPFEVEITGNIVGTRFIAGLVAISQVSLATGSGYIKSIAADGTMRIGAPGPISPADALVQLNDPLGRFGPKTTGMDERFQVDADNPSVTAETGYPMCILKPLSPTYCAAVNRSMPGRLFVMDTDPLPASPANGIPVPPCPACDQSKMVPLREGDEVIYSGILRKLPSGQRAVAAWALTANVGIYTKPGRDPAYVRIEGSLAGTVGPFAPRIPPVAGSTVLPDEVQDRFKIEGFTTDPTRPLIVYAIDVNPTSGDQFLRRLYTLEAKEPPRGRFFKVVGKNSGILFARNGDLKGNTRELMIRLGGAVIADGTQLDSLPETPVFMRPGDESGAFGNRYVAPVDEYIFPENKLPGDRLVANNFECLAFLVNGSGPIAPGAVVGRLNPWPNTTPSPALDCGTRSGPPPP